MVQSQPDRWIMRKAMCGATYNGRRCTLKPGHGGSIHSELIRYSDHDTGSYSWATGMGEPGPPGGVPRDDHR
jgi:hypothetical protein